MKVATVISILNLMLGLAMAAPPVIGTVTAGGAFRLNGDTVMTNGTLTEGAALESGSGTSSVRLAKGARLSLSAHSRAKLYSDRIVLEKGEARLESGVGFHLEVLGLTIRPDRGISSARIGLLDSKSVRVASQAGSFRVLNARGVLVANIAAGSAVAFEPRASAALTHITGTLIERSGHFFLTDQVTRVTVEVTGLGLAAYVGQVVGVTGGLNVAATSGARASQVIAATNVQTRPAGAAGAAIHGNTIVDGVAVIATGVDRVAAIATGGKFAASGTRPGSPPIGVPAGPPVTPVGRPPERPPVSPPGRPPGRPPVTPPEPRPISR